MNGKLYIQDVTLRDGMHAIRHQYGLDSVMRDRPRARRSRRRRDRSRAWRRPAGLAASTTASARIPTGNGSRPSPSVIKRASLTTLLLPGIGTVHDLRRAYDLGVRSVRIATHCTEADIAKQHIAIRARARHGRVGLPDDEPHDRARRAGAQAKLMECYGAHCVYVIDSGGALDMDDVAARFEAYRPRAASRRPSAASTRTTICRSASPTRSSRSQHGATASTPGSPAWAPAPAMRRWKCSSPRPTARAGSTAAISSS